jgi:TfoX/Sxy family transcriptional regulator of competence genes
VAIDEALLQRVRERLVDRADVVEKPMVGGRSFMVGGHLCCGVSGDALMVRVGPVEYERVLQEPHVRPLRMGAKAPMGYVLVDAAGRATDDALDAWLRRGIEFVSTLGRRSGARERRH